MMLRQSKGCYDPKDLEGVLPVLGRCLYNRGDGGVVLCSDLRAEASADLELGLRGTEGLLTVVVRRWDGRICPEVEYKDSGQTHIGFCRIPVYFCDLTCHLASDTSGNTCNKNRLTSKHSPNSLQINLYLLSWKKIFYFYFSFNWWWDNSLFPSHSSTPGGDIRILMPAFIRASIRVVRFMNFSHLRGKTNNAVTWYFFITSTTESSS